MGCGAAKEKAPGGDLAKVVPAADDSKPRISKDDTKVTSLVKEKQRMISKDIVAHGYGKAQFIPTNTEAIDEVYDVKKDELGKGSFGTVVRGVSKATGRACAIKSITKKNLERQAELKRFVVEIDVMKSLDHPNIIKLYGTFEDAHAIYLAMELCSGGELFDRIIEEQYVAEQDAALLVKSMLSAVFYMHHHARVAHRDLKPENFLLSEPDLPIRDTPLKLIDFGLSTRFEPGTLMTTKARTPYYVAPEVLKGGYSEKCDVWSLGVIAYILICGVPPFGGKNDAAILEKVKAGVLVFKTKVWDTVTEEGKTFIKNTLTLDVDERYSSKAALEDPWIANSAACATPMIRNSDSNYLKSLENFHKGNRLQKMSRHIVAMHISDSHIVKLKELFMAMDNNNDGTLTLEEVKQGLSQSGVEEWDDMDATLQGVDTDGSGVINYTEFLAATLTTRQRAQEDACWAAFRHFDHDRNGSITKEELREAMKDLNGRDLQVTEAEVTRVIEEVDTNGDGVIKFDEFMDMMRQQMVAIEDAESNRLLKTKTIVDDKEMDISPDISPDIE